MDKSFPLSIKVINGEVQEFPVVFYFKCNQLVPEGPAVVRYFDADMCSVAMKVFYLRYGQELFGSTQFKTTAEFQTYWFGLCRDNKIMLLINGCNMILNGKKISI